MSEAVEALKTAVEADTQEADASANAAETSQEATQEALTPEQWYSSLDDATRPHVDAYAGKLKTALDNERKQRKEYEKTIKELSAKAGKDNAISAELEDFKNKFTEANRKADFLTAATKVENLPTHRYEAAYKIAKLDGLIDEDTNAVDWDAMRQAHDYLFVEVSKKIAGNAGNGAGTKAQPKRDMNALIRGRA